MYQISLYIMVLLYVMAGINHFVHPTVYLEIMPGFISFPATGVLISGICEIVFSLMMLWAPTRLPGGWLLILLLIAIFPANIQMMLNYYRAHHPQFWLTILRLPLQVVLIWWIWRMMYRKYS